MHDWILPEYDLTMLKKSYLCMQSLINGAELILEIVML